MGLKEGLINTVFLTFIHNQDAIGYFLGILLSIGLLLYKPTRQAVLLLLGFTVLLLGYQYNKHIIEPLQDQTLTSLGLVGSDGGAKILLLRTFQKLMPVGFFVIGWGSVFLAIVLNYFRSWFPFRPTP